jgi:hypothetical protein
MLIYYFIFSCLASLALILKPLPVSNSYNEADKISLKIAFLTLLLFLTAFIGLRFNIGGDFGQYRFIYSQFAELSFLEALIPGTNRSDPGFALVNWLIHKIDIFNSIYWNYAYRVGGYNIVNVVLAFIFSFFFLKFSFSQPRPFLILALSFPYLIVVVAMGYIRQGVAIGLLAYALIELVRSKNLRFILLVLIAGSLHKSAFLFLPLVAYVNTDSKILLFIISASFLSLLGLVLLASEFERLISVYVGQSMQSSGAVYRLGLLLPAAFVYFLYQKKFSFNSTEHKIWTLFSVTSIAMFISVVSFGSSFSTSIDRIALYYLPFQVLILSLLPDIFNERNSFLVLLGLLLYYFLLFFIWLSIGSNNSAWVPYSNLLFLDWTPWHNNFL